MRANGLRRGSEWSSRIRSAVDAFEITIPTSDEPVISFARDINRADGDWVVLRITDPAEPADGRATGDWASLGNAIAYTSPFFLG